MLPCDLLSSDRHEESQVRLRPDVVRELSASAAATTSRAQTQASAPARPSTSRQQPDHGRPGQQPDVADARDRRNRRAGDGGVVAGRPHGQREQRRQADAHHGEPGDRAGGRGERAAPSPGPRPRSGRPLGRASTSRRRSATPSADSRPKPIARLKAARPAGASPSAAPASRRMKMPLQSNTAPSASRAQKAIAPSATSRREGRAKRGPLGGGSASAGGSPREATPPPRRQSRRRSRGAATGRAPAAAARPRCAAPVSAPNEKAAWSELKMRLPAGARPRAPRRSSRRRAHRWRRRRRARRARAWARHRERGRERGREQQRGRGHEPARADVAASAPVSGWASSRPSGAPSSDSPSVPVPRSSRSWMLGRREYQDTKTMPLRKKTAVTAARAREAACATPLWYYTAAPSAPPGPTLAMLPGHDEARVAPSPRAAASDSVPRASWAWPG